MKIAALFPFKAALVAASITTVGMVAINLFDTTDELPPNDPTPICIDLPPELPPTPPPPPENPPEPEDYAQPGMTVSL